MVYKLLANLAAQSSPQRRVNDLTMEEIEAFMTDQFDPNRFVVRERFKFWSEMKCRLGETIQELAARIRQDASTCDFPSIKDSLVEALRLRFVCSVSIEAVLKALFKVKNDELTFAQAIQIAMETEDAARVAKETVFGTKSELLHKVGRSPKLPGKSTSKDAEKHKMSVCYQCGKKGHLSEDCRFKNVVCNFCNRKGHLQSVCRKKKQLESEVKYVAISNISNEAIAAVPKLEIPVEINNQMCTLELDTAADTSFLSVSTWEHLGRPKLRHPGFTYQSASLHSMPVQGCFTAKTLFPKSG